MTTSDDNDLPDDVAEQLAALHEAMLDGDGLDPRPKDDQLGSGVDVLRLIEQVRTKERSFSLPSPSGARDPNRIDVKHPRLLGRYEIVRLLGEGSHGLVYLAVDKQLGRKVALKVPRVEVLLSTDLQNRFLVEAKAAAALSHPNIVPVFEAGNVGNVCFISYAYCEGRSLSEWFVFFREQQPPTPTLIAQLMATLADAVQYAHSRGVVHRDLKPSNLMIPNASVTPNDETVRQVQILDFGLAKSSGNEDQLTQTGAILGTPAYMSPEQALGRGDDVSHATDIYSLGAIQYELLCLQRPFEESSTLETLEAVRVREPIPPSRINRRTSRELEAICLKCLEKKPQDRYASAAQLREDLERCLRNEPVIAQPISQWEYARRWIARHPLVSGLSAALLLTLVISTLGFAALSMRLQTAVDRSRASEKEATALVAELSKDLESRTLQDLANAWTKVIESGSATAQSYFERGNCFWQMGKFDHAIADFESALSLDPNHLWANDYLAWICVAGPTELRDTPRAQKLLQRISGSLDSSWATLSTASLVQYRVGDFQTCIELAKRSVEKHGNQGTHTMQFILSMATQQLGNSSAAHRHYQLALEKCGNFSTNSAAETDLLHAEARALLSPGG